MPIMNKLKTVDLGTLDYTYYAGYDGCYVKINDAKPNTTILKLDGYTIVSDQVFDAYPTRDKVITVNVYSTFKIRNLSLPKNAAEYKQALDGVILTYETIDSVEEVLISTKNKIPYERPIVNPDTGEVNFTKRNLSSSVSVTFEPDYIDIKIINSGTSTWVGIANKSAANAKTIVVRARKSPWATADTRIRCQVKVKSALGTTTRWDTKNYYVTDDWEYYIFDQYEVVNTTYIIGLYQSVVGEELEISNIYECPDLITSTNDLITTTLEVIN